MKKKTGKTRTLYNSEFKEMAIKLAKELGSTREAAEAYINRGIAKTELKDYEGAIQEYTKAIELNPQDAEAYFGRGNAKAEEPRL